MKRGGGNWAPSDVMFEGQSEEEETVKEDKSARMMKADVGGDEWWMAVQVREAHTY